MAEYIERDAAIFSGKARYPKEADTIASIVCIPAADVRPVARAAWRGIGKTGRIFVCSACDNTFPYKTRYCPNCGAMMEVRE